MVLADENAAEQWRFGMTGGGATAFAFYGGTANNLTLERAGNSYFQGGNVGIGTTGPLNRLQIHTAANGGAEQVALTLGSPDFANEASDKLSIGWRSLGGSTIVSKIIGDGSGSLQFQAWNGASAADVVTFKNGGNVGIGTTSPSVKLHTYANSVGDAGGSILIQNAGANSYPYLGLKNDVV